MVIDPTITIGGLVTIALAAGSAIVYVVTTRTNVDAMNRGFERQDKIIAMLNDKIDRFGELLVMQGRLEERQASMQRDIEDLKRGEGKILPLARGAYEVGR